ncbi:MAG: hypothetical protein HUU54_01830 [Ignavibacteriaceae bacterium]|nr:hypothetical protein [Ignavibacteriaceae bacterium]
MKKLFLLFVLTVVLFNLSSYAQERNLKAGGYARVWSLGNNPYVADPELIKYNPAYAAQYSNMIWGDLGSAGNTDQFAAFNFYINDQITVGAMLTRDNLAGLHTGISTLDPGGVISAVNSYVGAGKVVGLNNNLELFGSYKMGDMVIGLGVAYASTGKEDDPGTGVSTGSASQLGLNAGVLMSLPSNLKLDAGLTFMTVSGLYEPNGGKKTEISNSILSIYAKVPYPMTSKMSLVPLVRFSNVGGSWDINGKSGDVPGMTELYFGLGMKYKGDDFCLIGGPAFIYESKSETKDYNGVADIDESAMKFPVWNLGAEWYATDWLIARCGYSAETHSMSKTTKLTPEQKQSETMFVPGSATVGLGLRFGTFALDGVVSANTIRAGLGNLSNNADTFSFVSASYAF